MTVSVWPTSTIRRVPLPCSVASRSGAWPGEEHGGRSTSTSSGSSAAQIAAHSSAPRTSPLGDETPTSASSSRSARRAISPAPSETHGSMPADHSRVGGVPELPEMEIVARRLAAALPGQVVESALAPGINALKTFDPPLGALEGRAFTGVRRRGKLLILELGELDVLVHLMTAGRMQLNPKRGSLRDKAARLMLRLPDDHELRVREFGSKQAMWLKVLRSGEVDADPALQG